MAHFIHQDVQSSLKDGIETILVPILDPHDLNRLALESGRGIYAVCEWLLTELGRWAELERVCGLAVSTEGNRVVVNLELRQPGRQLEEWLLRDHANTVFEGGKVAEFHVKGPLSERALKQEKFTDKHEPWWLYEAPS